MWALHHRCRRLTAHKFTPKSSDLPEKQNAKMSKNPIFSETIFIAARNPNGNRVAPLLVFTIFHTKKIKIFFPLRYSQFTRPKKIKPSWVAIHYKLTNSSRIDVFVPGIDRRPFKLHVIARARASPNREKKIHNFPCRMALLKFMYFAVAALPYIKQTFGCVRVGKCRTTAFIHKKSYRTGALTYLCRHSAVGISPASFSKR